MSGRCIERVDVLSVGVAMRLTRWSVVVTLTLTFLFALLLVGLSLRDGMQFDVSGAPSPAPSIDLPPVEMDSPPPPEADPSEQGSQDGGKRAVQVLLSLVGLLVVLLLVQVTRRGIAAFGAGQRRVDQSRRDSADDSDDLDVEQSVLPAFDDALDVGLGALGAAGTARNAIIAAWVALLAAVEEVGFEPAPSDTPTQFVMNLLSQTSVETAPLREFLAMYHVARFTDSPISEQDRTRAIELFTVLRAEVQASLISDDTATSSALSVPSGSSASNPGTANAVLSGPAFAESSVHNNKEATS